jgi:hypothetical protein
MLEALVGLKPPAISSSRRASALVLLVFLAGTLIRVLFLVEYRPAFLGDPDAGSYLGAAHGALFGNVYDPAGYPLFIRLVHWLDPHLTVLVTLQHLLGLATAALWSRTVHRLTGSRIAALLPALILLFDGYGLWVEHTPITETLFGFMVTVVLTSAIRFPASGWGRLLTTGALAGLLGAVRPVGLVLIPVLAVWLVAVGRGRRLRLLRAGVVVVVALTALGGYLLVQRSQTGFTGLTRDSGRVLYARAATFAQCSKFTPPPGTRGLCQSTPPSRRGSFNQYLTGYPDHASTLTSVDRAISPAWRVFGAPPAGNAALEAFALQAILHQPGSYLSEVIGDFHYYWSDDHRAFIEGDQRVDPDVEKAAGALDPASRGVSVGNLAFLRWYAENVELTGVAMIVLLLAPLLGILLSRGSVRGAAILLAVAGWLLPLAADAAASVDPRFVLPAYGPLAASTALGLAGARWPQRPLRSGQRHRAPATARSWSASDT